MRRSWEHGKWKKVGNRSWERRLATRVGKIHREKEEENKEQGLKTGAGNKD